MPRIVHIAIKFDDPEQATRFSEDVFGFRQIGTGYARGHIS
jgi:lactoylglutathione lyase